LERELDAAEGCGHDEDEREGRGGKGVGVERRMGKGGVRGDMLVRRGRVMEEGGEWALRGRGGRLGF
jgi:hypothetical protein